MLVRLNTLLGVCAWRMDSFFSNLGCCHAVQVLKQMSQHVLTDKGLQAFCDDWEKAKAAQKTSL